MVVAADDTQVIVARVIFFHLEKGFDYLTIGDGEVEDQASTIAALTGSLKVSALASSMSNMWMALTTDSTGHLEGYRFELEQIPAADINGNLRSIEYGLSLSWLLRFYGLAIGHLENNTLMKFLVDEQNYTHYIRIRE